MLRLFMPFGRVVRCDFCWHTQGPRKGEPRGYAFLEYATTEEAARAIAAMDGKGFRGRRLQVHYVREQEAQATDPRAFIAKAKAKASGGASSASSSSSAQHHRRAPAAGGRHGPVVAPAPPSAAAAGAGGNNGRRGGERGGRGEESAVEAKIRALKAILQQQQHK